MLTGQTSAVYGLSLVAIFNAYLYPQDDGKYETVRLHL